MSDRHTRNLTRLERFTLYLEDQLIRFNSWYASRQWAKHDRKHNNV